MPTSLGSGSGVQERGRTARTDSCLAVSWGLCRGPRAGLLGRGGGVSHLVRPLPWCQTPPGTFHVLFTTHSCFCKGHLLKVSHPLF